MRLRASDKSLLALLFLFAAVSLTLKGMLGPTMIAPPAEGPASVEVQLLTKMRAQGFSTSVRHLKIESPIVYARRGNCSLSARDAMGGAAAEALFADDARKIGPVRYLYNGESYTSPPALRMHLSVIQSSLLRSLGFRPKLHVPVALAASTACGNSAFGLDDIALTI